MPSAVQASVKLNVICLISSWWLSFLSSLAPLPFPTVRCCDGFVVCSLGDSLCDMFQTRMSHNEKTWEIWKRKNQLLCSSQILLWICWFTFTLVWSSSWTNNCHTFPCILLHLFWLMRPACVLYSVTKDIIFCSISSLPRAEAGMQDPVHSHGGPAHTWGWQPSLMSCSAESKLQHKIALKRLLNQSPQLHKPVLGVLL